jgi:alpha-tubulin suppressor-like RCC1 family protein
VRTGLIGLGRICLVRCGLVRCGLVRLMGPVVLAVAGSLAFAPPVLAVAPAGPALGTGNDHSCLIQHGRAYCWGFGGQGQLGNGRTARSSIPVAVDRRGVLAGKTLTAITAGHNFSCALDSAGKAYCWGDNFQGQLGNGSTTASDVPVTVIASRVLAGKRLTAITAGYRSTCALDTAGAAYCWGRDVDGELGNGTTAVVFSSVPVRVRAGRLPAGQTLTAITAGLYFACALDRAGAAYCWGDNSFGEFGNGASINSSVPVPVDASGALAGKTLTAISSGDFHTCVLDTAGLAYCWGDNFYGELGNGSTGSTAVPVAVEHSGVLAGKTLIVITAGLDFTCAVAGAGHAYCWGLNDYGQLGAGKGSNSTSVPVAVNSRGVLAGKILRMIAAGTADTCAQDTGGAAYCWGENGAGELGNGSTASSSIPVRVRPPAPGQAGQAYSRDRHSR